jgi:hypothetical protein
MGTLFVSLLLLFGSQTKASSKKSEIRIADSTGDWGYPNPYRHFTLARGVIFQYNGYSFRKNLSDLTSFTHIEYIKIIR